MNRLIELDFHKDMGELFKFLKSDKTRTYRNGDYFKVVYLKPPDRLIEPLNKRRLIVKPSKFLNVGSGWQVVRDLPIAHAPKNLEEVIEDLELEELRTNRQAIPLCHTQLFHWMKCGLYTYEDTSYFVRLFYLHGYSAEDCIEVFSSLVRRDELLPFFLKELNKIY